MTSDKKQPLWMKLLAVLALSAGLVAGLLALVAPLGVWFNWWDFRQGFAILGLAHGAALWIAIGGLLIAVAIWLLSRRTRPAPRLLGVAVAGALLAALAWYVPENYRPPDGTPAIHDITTDTDNPPRFEAILPLRQDAPNSAGYGESPEDMSRQELVSMQEQAYPEIEPQHFDAPPEEVFDRALAAVDALGWELVEQDREAGRIEATDTTFWFRFKDDVVIRIREDSRAGNGGTRLDARSKSRVGRSDVGKNAARLRALFAEL